MATKCCLENGNLSSLLDGSFEKYFSIMRIFKLIEMFEIRPKNVNSGPNRAIADVFHHKSKILST